jgi:voltage-gated potassium channel
MRRRHRFYRHVFVVCLLVMALMPLPYPYCRLALSGTPLLICLLIVELGQPVRPGQTSRHWSDNFYRLTGLVGIVFKFIWLASPATFAAVGFPLLLLVTVFIFWSLKRLMICLAQETRIGIPVLSGAVAGYLLLGISGGLLFGVMETVAPGSFLNEADGGRQLVLSQLPMSAAGQQVWSLDFMNIHYFAFVTLTTVGYGDILPVLPPAQMASVALSIVGQMYLAVVMGLLISRYTLQSEKQEIKDWQEGAPVPPPRSGVDLDDR